MPLTDQQLGSLDTLEWLIDERSRATGRSLAMSVAAIRLACRTPGLLITVQDHYQGSRYDLYHPIRHMVSRDYRLAPHLVINRNRGVVELVLNLPRPIEDWLPSEESLNLLSPAERGRAAGERYQHPSLAAADILTRFVANNTPMEMQISVEPVVEDGQVTGALAQTSIKPVEPEPEPPSKWDRLLSDEG